jgi:peptidoglycan/LPS O-acetylase OafA/YrhL
MRYALIVRYTLIAVAIAAAAMFAWLAGFFLLEGLASPAPEGDYLLVGVVGGSAIALLMGARGLTGQRNWGADLLSIVGFLWSLPVALLLFVSLVQPTLSPHAELPFGLLLLALCVGVFGRWLGRSMRPEISEQPRPTRWLEP